MEKVFLALQPFESHGVSYCSTINTHITSTVGNGGFQFTNGLIVSYRLNFNSSSQLLSNPYRF